MVRPYPTHLLNQEITVISGGIGYDEYGQETYSEAIVSSGTARLQFEDIRTVVAGGTIINSVAKAYISPTVTGVIGQNVEISGQKFKVNSIRPVVDGRGITRLKVLLLDEVAE